jgi:two-component system, NarL family, nitrate/nitrite response regulator NarL
MRCVTVVIADQHPIVLEGLKNVLGAQHDFKVVACCSYVAGCIEAIRNFPPNIAIIDVSMPDLIGPEILAIANTENLFTRLVFFASSDADRESIIAAAADAYCVILKGRGARNSRWGPAENRGWPEAATPSFLRLGRISRAEEWGHRRD